MTWGALAVDLAAMDKTALIDDRTQSRSTLVASQVPPGEWHQLFADPTVADAVLDRLLRNTVCIDLQGGSMRKKTATV